MKITVNHKSRFLFSRMHAYHARLVINITQDDAAIASLKP